MPQTNNSIEEQPWSGKTDGTKSMQQMLIKLFRYIDVRCLYAIMAVVIIFYMLFRRQGYLAQYHFFRLHLNQNPIKAFVNVYRNHFQFGQVVLDRFASYAGKRYKLVFDNENLFHHYKADCKGLFILFSHLGNFEIAGYGLQAPKPMHIVAFGGDTETVMENRYKMLCPNNIDIIPIANDLTHIFRINTALQKAEIVCMAGDRRMSKQRSVACNVLGKTALLPEGPFRIAATQKTHTLTIFVMKEKWDTYRIYQKEIHINPELPRDDLEKSIEQQYVKHLEDMIHLYPLQWYHYFDFWNEPKNS